MAYRNKTFVSFASEDIHYYRLMQAWRRNENIEFDFHDAHDLNTALDTSRPQTIRRRLRERLANTKQVVLLISEATRSAASRPRRFLFYEVQMIRKLELPVVFANLNGSRRIQRSRLPTALLDQYTISVPFRPALIRYALDDFVPAYRSQRESQRGPHRYTPAFYYFGP